MKELTDREYQLVIFDILKYFDAICKENNIKYSLCGGSLIGAIRHKGFIPWDDDIDIHMTREEYEKFKIIWNTEKRENYRWLDIEDFDNSFKSAGLLTKIIDKRRVNYRGRTTSCFLDIFVLDYIENTEKDRVFLKKYGWYIRAYEKNYKKYKESNNLIYKSFYKLNAKRYFRKMIKILHYYKNNDKKANNMLSIGFHNIEGDKGIFPAYYFENYMYSDFEGEKIPITTKYDELLRAYYGDYMQLPPEEERIPSHN